MKAVQATPKELRKIFADSYLIPDFQRPYSWEKEHCEVLWEDIVNFHATNPTTEERYFLGNIVVNATDSGRWSVVDGQQRLTTLLLLIKAFFESAGTYKALPNCLRILDKRTNKLTDDLRVKSEVLADDAENLHKIIFNNIENGNKSNLVINYYFFTNIIKEWRCAAGDSSEALLNLIDTFLDKIVLLPIECGSDDDALTIFQTINDRGMSLTDADIFKAKLYHSVPQQERMVFIDKWTQLGNPEDVERLFRILMHVTRANNGITNKEIGLRAFFTANASQYLSDWNNIIVSLQKIKAADCDWYECPSNYGEICSLWAVLKTYPNLYWNYPLYIFLHKYINLTGDGQCTLSEEHSKNLEQLLTDLIRYYFIKGVVHNSVNVIKDTTFKICANIASGKEYSTELDTNISTNDKESLATLLIENSIGQRYMRGLVVLASYLNPNQDKQSFADMLYSSYDIEHILPREWNHYDGWTQDDHKKCLNWIGNLMPLERAKNIKAKNEYLRKKKEFYKDSIVQDAKDMLSIADDKWTPEAVKEKHAKKIDRLKVFFKVSTQ